MQRPESWVRHERRASDLVIRGVLLALLLFAGAASAASMFEDVLVDSDASGTTLRVIFTAPIRYQSHTPASAGHELRIVLKPLSEDDFPKTALFGTESRSWSAKESHALRSLRYEGSETQGAILTLKFAREVSFTVRSTPDMRTLVVNMKLSSQGPAEAAVSAPVTYSQMHGEETPTVLPPAQGTAQAGRGKGYVLYLQSSARPIDAAGFSRPKGFEDKSLFVSQAEVRGKRWYRLTLGYFADRKTAGKALQAIRQDYPSAWVGYVSQGPGQFSKSGGAPKKLGKARSASLLRAGRQAMLDGDYPKAIRMFKAAVNSRLPEVQKEARELLGLARERNHQFAQARAEYEEYLRRYPEGADADRVRQRLAGVLTVQPSERETEQALARKEEKPKESAPSRPLRWNWYGTLSQEYLRDETTSATDPAQERINTSNLSTNLNLTVRGRGPAYDLRVQADVQHDHDLESASGTTGDYAISNFYFDLQHKSTGASARVGRQRQSSAGVLGRFDGLFASYPLNDSVTAKVVAGYPVDLNEKTRVQEEIHFYGISADIQPLGSDWSYNAFYIRQEREGYLDRQAIGGEVRYFSADRSLFTQLDYDVTYSRLNIFLAQANWNLSDRDAVYATLDYRQSPILTTGNALIGQTVGSLKQLSLSNSVSQIRQLAEDRTAAATTLTLGGSHRIREDLQLSGDVTASKTGSTPASGGVAATPATDLEWLYSVQILANNLWFEGDSSIVTLRYGDTTASSNYTISMDYRKQLRGGWRINPRLLLDYRDQKSESISQLQIRPAIRAEYRVNQSFEIDLEGGLSWEHENDKANGDSDTAGYYVSAGYRWDF